MMKIVLDAMGGELGKLPVTLRDSEIPPVETGHIFTPDVGIPVDGGCADIRLRLVTVTSGDYTYRVEGGTVTTDYTPSEPWHYDPHAGGGRKAHRGEGGAGALQGLGKGAPPLAHRPAHRPAFAGTHRLPLPGGVHLPAPVTPTHP